VVVESIALDRQNLARTLPQVAATRRGPCLAVASWNLLASSLDRHPNPASSLAWAEGRLRDFTSTWVPRLAAFDVLCLQEVDSGMRSDLRAVLGAVGFADVDECGEVGGEAGSSSRTRKRSRQREQGISCCVFFRRDRFVCKKVYEWTRMTAAQFRLRPPMAHAGGPGSVQETPNRG